MKKLVEFIVANHTKFEYDENNNISNLEYLLYNTWNRASGDMFTKPTEYRIAPKLEFTEQDMIEFVYYCNTSLFNVDILLNKFRESGNGK